MLLRISLEEKKLIRRILGERYTHIPHIVETDALFEEAIKSPLLPTGLKSKLRYIREKTLNTKRNIPLSTILRYSREVEWEDNPNPHPTLITRSFLEDVVSIIEGEYLLVDGSSLFLFDPTPDDKREILHQPIVRIYELDRIEQGRTKNKNVKLFFRDPTLKRVDLGYGREILSDMDTLQITYRNKERELKLLPLGIDSHGRILVRILYMDWITEGVRNRIILESTQGRNYIDLEKRSLNLLDTHKSTNRHMNYDTFEDQFENTFLIRILNLFEYDTSNIIFLYDSHPINDITKKLELGDKNINVKVLLPSRDYSIVEITVEKRGDSKKTMFHRIIRGDPLDVFIKTNTTISSLIVSLNPSISSDRERLYDLARLRILEILSNGRIKLPIGDPIEREIINSISILLASRFSHLINNIINPKNDLNDISEIQINKSIRKTVKDLVMFNFKGFTPLKIFKETVQLYRRKKDMIILGKQLSYLNEKYLNTNLDSLVEEFLLSTLPVNMEEHTSIKWYRNIILQKCTEPYFIERILKQSERDEILNLIKKRTLEFIRKNKIDIIRKAFEKLGEKRCISDNTMYCSILAFLKLVEKGYTTYKLGYKNGEYYLYYKHTPKIRYKVKQLVDQKAYFIVEYGKKKRTIISHINFARNNETEKRPSNENLIS